MFTFKSISCIPLRSSLSRHSVRQARLWNRGFYNTSTRFTDDQGAPPPQSVSPLAPIGVSAAIQATKDSTIIPRPKIFDEFSLRDRVGIVTGGNSGLGLEMALALCEAGARAIYCLDLPSEPSAEWKSTQEYIKRMDQGSRLEYVCADVTDQKGIWDKVKEVGDKEKRMDVCVAAAGIAAAPNDVLDCPASKFQQVLNVNLNGVLYSAQAAGQQMVRFGNTGSIIMIASIAGSLALRPSDAIEYGASKSGVLQLARTMACELAPRGIRVNTISPGYIYTPMTIPFLGTPGLLDAWSSQNPMGRIGRPDELRGVVAWLASNASSYCTGSNITVSGGHHAL